MKETFLIDLSLEISAKAGVHSGDPSKSFHPRVQPQVRLM